MKLILENHLLCISTLSLLEMYKADELTHDKREDPGNLYQSGTIEAQDRSDSPVIPQSIHRHKVEPTPLFSSLNLVQIPSAKALQENYVA